MKKRNASMLKSTLVCIVAGIAAVQLAREIPAMIRYLKMERL
jgi:hypothetical protein